MRRFLLDRPLHDRATDAGLLAIRVYAGLALAFFHGLGKLPPSPDFVSGVAALGFPAPELFAWLVTAAELGGGVLLAAGLLTRPIALFVLIHFTLVVLVAHGGDPLPDRELPIYFGATALLFLLAGPGRYSLDALLLGRRG